MRNFNRIVVLCLLAFITFSMKTDQVTRVIFFGDSITQMGVDKGGYITLIRAKIDSAGQSGQYNLIGAGIGGNKVYDLYLRLEEDVITQSPDIVVIWVGVNDVWHKSTLGTGTDEDKFGRFYQAIITRLKSVDIKVILCTPACIGEKTDCTNQQDGDLNQYSWIIRELAVKNDCKLCDLRKFFLEYNLLHNRNNDASGILTTDGVHLSKAGNQLVADEFSRILFP